MLDMLATDGNARSEPLFSSVMDIARARSSVRVDGVDGGGAMSSTTSSARASGRARAVRTATRRVCFSLARSTAGVDGARGASSFDASSSLEEIFLSLRFF
jgi:hypothetical protein